MDFFSLGEFSVYRINFFPLFFIAFRQRSCPCPWSSLGRRLAVLKKITGLQRVALTIKARAGEVREEATMTPEFFCSTSTNFFLPQNFAGVGDGREVLQTESDSYFGNTSTFPSCDFAQRRYPVGYLSVTFSFLPIFPLLTEEIVIQSTYHTSLANELSLVSLLQGKKGLCYAEYMVCNLLFLPWHFSSASLLWKRNPIATAWFFSCFSDVIFLRIASYESVNKVCSWWHFASSVTTLYALIN